MASSSTTKRVVEVCWTLVGRRRGRIWYARRMDRTSGAPATVAFDAAAVLAREEARGDVVGFFHTHPHTPPRPSRRDVRTMRAWRRALGKPLLCVIAGQHETAAFRFDEGGRSCVRLADVEAFPRGVVIAAETRQAPIDDL